MKTVGHQQGLAAWQRYSPAARIAISAFTWIQLIGFLIGLFVSRVVVSDVGITLGLAAGALCGIGWVALVEMGIRRSDENSTEMRNIRQQRLLRSASVRVPFMFVIGLMFGYGAIAWGLTWTVNILVGTRSTQIVTVTGWISGGRSSCTHPQIGHFLFADSPGSLCVEAGARAHMPDGARLRLVGNGSIFGLNVEEIYAENDPPEPRTAELSLEHISAPPDITCEANASARSEVRVRHVAVEAFPKDTPLVKAATPEELRAAYNKLQRARDELVRGESIESVWTKYSDPQTSGGTPDGDIGFFRRGQLVPEFERVVFCLPVGEFSPVFRTVFGFHVAQVTEVR